jgi:hypothetical protein
MKPASFICALMLLLLPASGCGDDEVCENFDTPSSQSCEGNSDCSELNCETLCASDLSESRGGAFCSDALCYCPCRVCVF